MADEPNQGTKRRRFVPAAILAGLCGTVVIAGTLGASLSGLTATITNSTNTAASAAMAIQETSGAFQCNSYKFLVTNAGNVALTNVSVTDTQIAPAGSLASGPTCPSSALAVGASMTCTGTYKVTQADLDNGSVNDSAVAHGTPPGSTTPITTSPSTATVPAANEPGLTIVKRANVTELTHAGQIVTYSFYVTNSGNQTLTHIAVNDQLPGLGPITCPITTLTPGQDMVCHATYTVTATDMQRGGVVNTATATGNPPGWHKPPTKSVPSTVLIPARHGGGSAVTGVSSSRLLNIGLFCLLVGSVLLVIGRRRRHG